MIIAQMTDFHIGRPLQVAGEALSCLARLQAAVAHLNACRPRPDLVFATGDLANHGAEADYRRVRDALGALGMPCYLLPGNHDHRETLREVFSDHDYLGAGPYLQYVLEYEKIRIIALDTLHSGEHTGLLCDERLDWFEQCLAADTHKPTLVFMHHPPIHTGVSVFERFGLRVSDRLHRIVAANSQIQMIACGHVHRSIQARWAGTLVTTTPSVSFQYPLDLTPHEDLDPILEPPAVRLIVDLAEAGLVSHLSYVKAYPAVTGVPVQATVSQAH